jgi:polyisoprenoid-binding protein YceI
MKKLSFLLAFAVLSLFVLSNDSTTARNTTVKDRFSVEGALEEGMMGAYGFDKAHSSIGFRVKHMGLVDVPGYFREFTGTINYDPKDVTKSTVEFSAQIASVDTGVEGRDKHLQRDDFFDAAKFPAITFKSTKVEKKGNNLILTGDLTMRGVTKSISFPFNVVGFLKDPRSGGMRMGATAETVVNRKDFGINYDSKLPNGTSAVSDNITVVLNLEAVMAAPKTDSTTTK